MIIMTRDSHIHISLAHYMSYMTFNADSMEQWMNQNNHDMGKYAVMIAFISQFRQFLFGQTAYEISE